jgi:glycosyltransferase involved in cell wall biosynthesis
LKVAVVNNQAPFLRGGAELLVEWLVEALEARGHQAEAVRLPFSWNPPSRVLDSMLAARLVRLPNVDRVVALKFPAYYVPHDDKVLWLMHQFRQAHDLWGTPLQGLPDEGDGLLVRDAVRDADRALLKQARGIFTNSKVVSGRLERSTGLDSEVLYPPLRDASGFRCEAYEPFVFYPSRITAAKRQFLAIEAIAHAGPSVRLVVAGAPETPQEEARLRELIERHGLADRVELRLGWLDEEVKRDLLARAAAVVYLPYDEDSYGYVTLEAFHSRKPVISCTDAGGVDAVVIDGESGWLCEPDAEQIGAAIAQAISDPAEARRRGEAGLELLDRLEINWDHVVERLTA